VVLDDISYSADLVRLVLESHLPCRVMTFTNTADLRTFISSHVPSLYLLDIRLRNSSGIDVCYEIHSMADQREVPIIFFSAHGDPKTRVAALKAGAVDYIDKPFYPEELLTRVRRHLELHEANEQLRKQFDEQQALLRVLCHDLRNPIGGALSMLDIVSSEENSHPEEIGLALQSCEKAIELIEHISSQRSLLGAGNDALATESVSLKQAVADAVALIQPLAMAKNITIDVAIPADRQLRSQRIVLTHNILNNLLHNAIKFSHPGQSVQVSVEESPQPQHARLVIRDQGIGMPSPVLNKLFSHTATLPRPGTSNEKGTGLGMGLVKRYVERLNATIDISSVATNPGSPEEHSGTTVTLDLPLA
jgi:signal transduction histidine kinase